MTPTPQPQGVTAGQLGECGIEHDEHCITCGDVAVELTVTRVDRDRMLALCANEAGDRESVEIALVGEVRVGDTLLVHAGTAIALLTQEAVS